MQALSPETVAAGYAWLGRAWNEGYQFAFSWGGLPINQTPEDIVWLQQILWASQPDAIVETGVADGGSLLLYATVCQLFNPDCRIIGIEKRLRPAMMARLRQNRLAETITIVEGDSRERETADRVQALLKGAARPLIILDASHRQADVMQELELYSPWIRPGGFLLVADTLLADMAGQPNGKPRWRTDNARQAVAAFLEAHPDFCDVTPQTAVTFFQGGILRRRP